MRKLTQNDIEIWWPRSQRIQKELMISDGQGCIDLRIAPVISAPLADEEGCSPVFASLLYG